MKLLDRVLQRWRIAKVSPYLPPGGRVLDIGCADGALFRQTSGIVKEGIGIDPSLAKPVEWERYRLVPGSFPTDLPDQDPFDAIALLALLEHIPQEQLHLFATQCAKLLKPGGVLIATVPSPIVDPILDVLRRLRLIDGMSLEEHHGFDVRQTPGLFAAAGLEVLIARKFQLGCNNLFVFRKPLHGAAA